MLLQFKRQLNQSKNSEDGGGGGGGGDAYGEDGDGGDGCLMVGLVFNCLLP